MAITTPTSFWKLSSTTDELWANTLTNTGSVTFSAWFIGNAANFDTTNKRLSVASSIGYSSSSTNTWAFMFKPNSVAISQYFLDIGVTSSRHIILYASNTDLRFYCSWTDTSTWITLSSSTWYRVVITHNAGSFAVYVDNVLKISPTSWTTWIASTFFSLGAAWDSFWANSNCQIDACWVWSVVLNSTEINELYNSGNWQEYPFSSWNSWAWFFLLM